MPSPFMVIMHTGWLEASNFSTTGGRVPGGSRLSTAIPRFPMELTAESALVPGWK